VVSFGLAIILGITSLPSVTDVLTWKEFAFVQSKLGWLCLCFGTAHDLFMGWKAIFVETSVVCGVFFSATMVSSKFQTLYTVKLPFLVRILFTIFSDQKDWKVEGTDNYQKNKIEGTPILKLASVQKIRQKTRNPKA
jgi:hypothetical protein